MAGINKPAKKIMWNKIEPTRKAAILVILFLVIVNVVLAALLSNRMCGVFYRASDCFDDIKEDVGICILKTRLYVKDIFNYEMGTDKLWEPTEDIKILADKIFNRSNGWEKAIKYAQRVVSRRIKFAKTDKPPKSVKGIERLKLGDCVEKTYYLYSLLREIEKKAKKNGWAPIKISFIDIYTGVDNSVVNHMALLAEVEDKKIYIDSTYKGEDFFSYNDVKEIKNCGIFRLLNERQAIALYYREKVLDREINEILREYYLKRAFLLDPESPRVLYAMSRMEFDRGILDKRNYMKSYGYSKSLILRAPWWLYGWVHHVYLCMELKKYDEAMMAADMMAKLHFLKEWAQEERDRIYEECKKELKQSKKRRQEKARSENPVFDFWV